MFASTLRCAGWLLATTSILCAQSKPLGGTLTPSDSLESGSIPRELSRVLVDDAEDGTWVLGRTYKMHFTDEGTTFWPCLGPKATRTYPLRLRMESAVRGDASLPWNRKARPVSGPHVVRLERETFEERWNLSLEKVEQSFLLPVPTGKGDLVLRLAVESELPVREESDGLFFDLPGGESIVYGPMHVYDEGGATYDAPSRWVAGAIELRVPDAFLRNARGRVTVDPILTKTQLGSPSDDLRLPDVAFNALSDRYLVVCERFFSQFDIDIIGFRLSGSNVFIEEVPIEISNRESLNPAIAGNVAARQFMVVWDEDRTADRIIRGRTAGSNSGSALGTTFTVVDDSLATNERPDIGGSSGTGAFTDRYLIACEEVSLGGSSNLRVLVVDTTGAVLSNMNPVPGSGPETQIAVTKTRGEFERWMIAFRDSGGNISVLVTSASGLITLPPFPVGSLGLTTNPAVAGDGQAFFVVWESRVVGGNTDISGAVLDFRRSVLVTRIPETNLTALEGAASVAADQTQPCVSYDGCRFVYTYIEAGFHPFAATAFITSTIVLHEQHQPLELSTFAVSTSVPQMTSRFEGGGQPGRYMIVWNRDNGTNFVAAGHYDGVHFTFGAQPILRVQTGCGLFEPDIESTAPPALGAHFTVTTDPIQPTNQLVLFGLLPPQLIPLCTATGTGGVCTLGVLPILVSQPGNTLTVPIPCDPLVLGARVAFQGVYVINFGGCPANVLGVPLYVSDTLIVTIG
ncbi:MAG: hypothetical protein H6833_12295 [Planctomycetes bacterium]|nr:hypothetical protein [Planctomycetota bacterium]